MTKTPAGRAPLHGVTGIVRFNAPVSALAIFVVVFGVVVLGVAPRGAPWGIRRARRVVPGVRADGGVARRVVPDR